MRVVFSSVHQSKAVFKCFKLEHCKYLSVFMKVFDYFGRSKLPFVGRVLSAITEEQVHPFFWRSRRLCCNVCVCLPQIKSAYLAPGVTEGKGGVLGLQKSYIAFRSTLSGRRYFFLPPKKETIRIHVFKLNYHWNPFSRKDSRSEDVSNTWPAQFLAVLFDFQIVDMH